MSLVVAVVVASSALLLAISSLAWAARIFEAQRARVAAWAADVKGDGVLLLPALMLVLLS